ncbi:MAG: maleylpyruvate isomerase N-terminal domain-containing protein [Ilumatobacteraceae bacterium]
MNQADGPSPDLDRPELDRPELDRDVGGAANAHQRLLATLDAWLERGDAAPDTASRLPGWTIGHVLTHLARQAESVERMLAGRPQYPGGREERDAEIDAGAGRDAEELVADVRRTIWSLESAWASHRDWDATAERISGPTPMHELPFLRWRETEVHHVDLGLGAAFADVSPEYLRLELRRMEMLWRARRPMGMTPLPAAALARPPHERLAWLLGRHTIEGLEPAGIY